jgi:hypothetical protein
MREIDLPSMRMPLRIPAVFNITCLDRNTQVLVFNARIFAEHVKNEATIRQEILKSYKHKQPHLNDSIPRP